MCQGRVCDKKNFLLKSKDTTMGKSKKDKEDLNDLKKDLEMVSPHHLEKKLTLCELNLQFDWISNVLFNAK